MTVQQTNRMIAEYMGMTEDEYPSGLPHGYTIFGHFLENSIHYHDRIEWLYPVARKVKEELEKICAENKGAENIIEFNAAYHWAKLCEAGTLFTIESLYPVVVECIEFLNKQKEA